MGVGEHIRKSNGKHQLRADLFSLAWPAMLEHMLQSALFMINTALAGRLGATALAAGGISNILLFFTFAVFMGIGVGALALIARAHGANDIRMAHRAGRQAMITAITVSSVSAGVLGLWSEQILSVLGATQAVIDLAVPYLILGGLSAPFQAIVVIVGSIMRGAGDTRTPMFGSGVMALINLILGFLLVFDVVGPGGLGFMGIGIAFCVARISAAILMLVLVYRSPFRAGIIGPYRPDFPMLRRLWRVAAPAAGEQVIHIGGVIAFSTIGLQLGAVSFAGQNVVGAIISIAYMPSFGIGLAASTAVGQSLGARKIPLAVDFAREATLWGTIVSMLVGVLMLLFPRHLVGIFTSAAPVIDIAEAPVRIIGLFMPVVGLSLVIPGALRGAGDTRATFVISLIALWLVRVPLALTLGIWAGLGLPGIWLAGGLQYTVFAALSLIRFCSGRWKTIHV